MAIQWTLRRATRVIAVSHPLAGLARDLGVPPERVEVVENGVDTEIFRPSIRAEARRLLGVDTDTRLLISVGHLVPLKGFDRMIRALAELHRTDPRVKLALVGGTASTSGNYPRELRQLAAQLGVSSHVSFTGALAPEQVRTWLNAADLFVLCSDREGCPNVVWEAMACGLPIASAKVGEVEYMVPPGAGVLFDNPSDVKALRETIGIALNTHWDAAEIRRHAESHTWAHVAERVLQQWRICIRGTEAAIDALATADGGLKPTR
jgi:glycosyltransferase involved in cell wall biosynthesis